MGHYHRYGKRRPHAMGDVAGTIGTALDVASDPYLNEIVCRVQQLKNIDHNEPVGVCAETPAGIVGGIGLRNAVVPLRAIVYAQQNKWVYPLAIAALIGIPVWVGYEIGRSQ